MVYVPVTDSERARGKGQDAPAAPGEGEARTRVRTRARTMLAALPGVTQRAHTQRVVEKAAAPRWEADGLEEALADSPNLVKVTHRPAAAPEVAGTWWETGPLPPHQQWDRFRGWLAAADHGAVRVLVVVLGLPVTIAGLLAAAFVKLTQHPGGMALLTVVLGIWWAATLADAPPLPVGPAAVPGGAP